MRSVTRCAIEREQSDRRSNRSRACEHQHIHVLDRSGVPRAIPEFLQQRSYPAVADGSYSNVIRLTGNFVNSAGLDWNIVYRSTHDGSTTLGFHDPPLWEQLDPRSYFLIYGSSDYRSTSEYGEWGFWGHVTFCAERQPGSDPACAVPETTCESTRHRLRVSPN